MEDAKTEADGTGGSKQKMVGKIALLKIKVANKQESDYQKENTRLESLKNSIEKAKAKATIKAESEFNGNALLLRIRAMFDLKSKDKIMLGVYILFIVLLFCIEFLVVLIKIASNHSVDEDLEKAREQLLRTKTQKTLNRSEVLYQPELHVTSVQNANNFLKKNVTSVFNTVE